MSIGLPENETPLEQAPSLEDAGILVVDDDPAFQLGLKTFLREYAGFEKVFTARSGDDALKLIDLEPSIEVITLDNEMPGMTGIEMLAKLTESSPRALSVVMITGEATPKLEKKFHKFGSAKLLTNHYLAKPVAFEELEPVILRAYEELKSQPPAEDPNAQSLIAEKTVEKDENVIEPTVLISPPGDGNDQLEELKIQLERNTETLNALRARIPTIEQRFWMGILKILTVGVLIWLGLQLDGFNYARKWGNQLKALTSPAAASVELKEPEEKIEPKEKAAPVPEKEVPKSAEKKKEAKPGGFQPVTGPVEEPEKKTPAKP